MEPNQRSIRTGKKPDKIIKDVDKKKLFQLDFPLYFYSGRFYGSLEILMILLALFLIRTSASSMNSDRLFVRKY